ncbi:MAG: hypothetical protein ACFFC7_25190 [Candidatus Hermodarchaeota archaeon]
MNQRKSEIKSVRIIINYMDGSEKSKDFPMTSLRAGENPHQEGFVGMNGYKILYEGRGMSFTNHLDLIGYAAAFEMSQTMKYLGDKRQEAVVINKHTIPAIFSVDENQCTALKKSLKYDPKSPFGGIMCTSSPLTIETAKCLKRMRKEKMFTLDVLASPGFEPGSIETITQIGSKKERMYNLRVVDVSELDSFDKIMMGLDGCNITFGIGSTPIITTMDTSTFFNTKCRMEVVSEKTPDDTQYIDAHLAWIGAKYVKSNSFSFVRGGVSIAQCGGQTNREDSARFAAVRAKDFGNTLENTIGATDSFLFNADSIDILHEMGVAGIVHPTRKGLTTGSLKPDEKILDRINKYEMIMVRPVLGTEEKEVPWRVFRHL